MEFQTAQGSLYYEVTGQGRPLILLHGNGEDHSIFDKAVPLLSQHFQVFAIDTRGHGQSFPVQEYHYQDMTEDIRQFIHGLLLEKPVICGFSDGGILALLLASQQPEMLGGIVACGINTKPHGDQTIYNNNYEGQFCLHMLGSKTHGSDKVDSGHQRCIEEALNYM